MDSSRLFGWVEEGQNWGVGLICRSLLFICWLHSWNHRLWIFERKNDLRSDAVDGMGSVILGRDVACLAAASTSSC